MFCEGSMSVIWFEVDTLPQIKSNPYDFHKLCPISTPFPLHIHFHMDFHSTEGLYCLPLWINTWHSTHRKVKKWHKVTQIYGMPRMRRKITVVSNCPKIFKMFWAKENDKVSRNVYLKNAQICTSSRLDYKWNSYTVYEYVYNVLW